ncbi:HTH domain-containing protein [Natronorubrum sp. FCH18a]|uniref:HTH domain-containing protein n=1 Tax=Natronorubrum sp. FCH18a TaxID=3447018 RepID=UPI003F516373
MPSGNAEGLPAVDIDSRADLRVDCYVRSSIPAPLRGTIDTVVDRLQRLCEHGSLLEYRLSHWPPEPHASAESADERELTRAELVSEFEQWADRRNGSLEPAFRRREIPASAFGIGGDEPYERTRVPIVTLAVYDANAEADAESGALRGVLPYTERAREGRERTYTVDEWLSELETAVGLTPESKRVQQSLSEGH